MKHQILISEFISNVAYTFINIYKRFTSNHVLIGYNARVHLKSRLEGYNKIEKNTIFSGELGLFSYVGANSMIIGKIGRFCSISGNVTFLISTHPFKDWVSTHPVFYSLKEQSGITFVKEQLFSEIPIKEGQKHSIEIGNDVYIGFGATLIGPIKIGDGAVIGACSVVTKDVPPYAIVAGNPARIVRYRFLDKEIEKLLLFKWWNKDLNWLKTNASLFINMESFNNLIK